MPKILIGISILLMALALLFGFLNTNKVKTLRNELMTTASARDRANRGRVASEKKLKAEEKELNDAKAKKADAEAKAQGAEAELSKAQMEKAEAQAMLQANEVQIADLQKQIADVTAGAGAADGEPIAGAPHDAQAALEDAKKELDAAEQEKSILADKMKAAQDQVAALQEEKKRRESGSNTPGVHGTVLAVNQAYNFVVLGIGEHQGVVPNSEMIVMRAGSLIGKIRISSVEPTTSIGDIITSSLPRGVEVQPGDTVVYAGNPNS
ncbi:MAG: hypothetical protein ABI233_09325 [Chthoniobacterales bacterium]